MGRVIDPRVAPKVNDAERVRNLLFRTETTGVTDPKPVSIFDFEGRPFISGMSDRSQAGETVTNINGVQLARPVNLEGGQNYMFQNPGLLWANAPTEAKYINDFAQHLRGQYGKDPLYLPWRMGPASADSSTMTGDVMLSYAQSALGKRDKNAVNKYIRENYIPDWYGLDDPRSMGQWNNLKASKRADFVNKFGNVGNVNQFGGLTTGEARAIVTEPFQYSAPDMRLQNVGLLSGRNIVPSKHSTYKAAFEGEGLGKLIEGDVTPFDLNPTMKAKAGFADYERNVDRANLTGDDMTSLMFNVVGGQITDKVLKNLEKAGVTAAGLATIGAAGASPPEFLDRIYNPQNHKFIMNNDGTISTHLMAAEMDRDGNWYVFPLIQEDADGNLNDYRNDFDTAMEKAITSGNFLPFGQNKDAALEFSKNYKQGTPLEDFNPMKPTIQQNMESMINTPRRAEVTPIKRNAALGIISDAFKLGKDVLNDMPNLKALVGQAFGDVGFGAEVVGAPGREPDKVEGTLPLGDFIYGEAPEGFNELSYGFTPTDQQLVDAGLLGAGAAKPIIRSAKAVAKGGKALLEGAPEVAGRMYENAMNAIGANRYMMPPSGNPAKQLEGFYSPLERAAQNFKRNSGPGQGYLNDLSGLEGVTKEEIEWIGLDKFLKSKPNFTKEEVQKYIADNRVTLEEVEFNNRPIEWTQEMKDVLNEMKTVNNESPEYADLSLRLIDLKLAQEAKQKAQYANNGYTLPYGSNNTELVLKLPKSKYVDFPGLEHYLGETNNLGWIRLNERIDTDGKRMLFIEEIQSDWHQKGNVWGYTKQKTPMKYHVDKDKETGNFLITDQNGNPVTDRKGREVRYFDSEDAEKYADRINAEGSHQAPESPFKDSWYKLLMKRVMKYAADNGYDRIGLIGSDKIVERTGPGRHNRILLNNMKWYDQIYPKFLKQYGEKHGGKFGETYINIGEESPYKIKYLDLTGDLESKVKGGQPMFNVAPVATGGLISQNKENNRKNARNLDTGLLF